MWFRQTLKKGFLVATAGAFVAAPYVPGSDEPGPVLSAAASVLDARPSFVEKALRGDSLEQGSAAVVATARALRVIAASVGQLSHPRALESAFHGYFAYREQNPEAVRKPYLYFVDFGLPATEPRGYLFDMESMTVVDGPFTVSHGRGSGTSSVPRRFSNKSGSNATSLGLYLAQETYRFHGKAGGRAYSAMGLRMDGLSEGWNDNARQRRVVAHGAPYVTPARAGLSEGCPAMEMARAKRLLPMLSDGGMVFLFAPDSSWLSSDPWVSGATDLTGVASAGG